MPKVELICDYCGKSFYRYLSCVTGKHKFCCPDCANKFHTKALNPDGYTKHEHLTKYNEAHNCERMTPDTRAKLSRARFGTGKGICYAKRKGKHEHRSVMEWMLGRFLRPGEVVHHIDGNKRNNSPENLLLFPSQSAHAAYHWWLKKRGDAL